MPEEYTARLVEQVAGACGGVLGKEEARRLVEYGRQLMAANQRVNLTGAHSLEELAAHLVDCAAGVLLVDWSPGQRVLDLGSGGGLPGIPLALLRPGLQVVLVDSRARKVAVLEELISALGLANCRAVWARAEVLGRDAAWRGGADVVVARGLAPWVVLVEYALPLLRVGGRLVAWKGPGWPAEVEAGGAALQDLGGVVAEIRQYRLADGRQRALLEVFKARPTPEGYPRAPALIQRQVRRCLRGER